LTLAQPAQVAQHFVLLLARFKTPVCHPTIISECTRSAYLPPSPARLTL
jgi:hypothetical protein